MSPHASSANKSTLWKRPVATWFVRTLGVIYFASGVVLGLPTLWLDFSVIPGGASTILACASGAVSVGAVQFFRAAKETNLTVADVVIYFGILVPVGAAWLAMVLQDAAAPYVALGAAYATAIILGLSVWPRLTSWVLVTVDPTLPPLLALSLPKRIGRGAVLLILPVSALVLSVVLAGDSIRAGH